MYCVHFTLISPVDNFVDNFFSIFFVFYLEVSKKDVILLIETLKHIKMKTQIQVFSKDLQTLFFSFVIETQDETQATNTIAKYRKMYSYQTLLINKVSTY